MKCDNCGYTFNQGIACPLCGHRVGKISKCSVCGNVIMPGVSHCSSCGSPTKYQKRVDVSSKYHISENSSYTKQRVATDYNKHSNDSHTYNSQEMYDYKSSNNEIKQRIEEARSKMFNSFNVPTNKKIDLKGNNRSLVIGIVVVLVIAIIFSNVFFGNDEELVDLASMSISGTNNQLTMAGNFNHGGYCFQDGDDVYLSDGYELLKTSRNLSDLQTVDEVYGYGDIYVEKNCFYTSYDDSYGVYDLGSNESGFMTLVSADNVLPLGNNCFAYSNYNDDGSTTLRLYNNGTISIIVKGDIAQFTYDYTDKLIYVANYSKINSYDLNGEHIYTYNIVYTGDFYVDNKSLYFTNEELIGVYDLNNPGNSYDEIFTGKIANFICSDYGFVYQNSDGNLYFYDTASSKSIHLCDNVTDYNVLGNRIYVTGDIAGDDSDWYLCDKEGNVAAVN